MKKIQRNEVMDFVTYNEQRVDIQKAVFKIKGDRRIHLGEHLTFLFENADTMRYQVHELMRAESIVKESEVQFQIDVFNNLLGSEGELSCTLLIEIEDAVERPILLRRWRDLPKHIHLTCLDGSTILGQYDEDQISDDKASSVQFIKFFVGKKRLKGLRCDHPAYQEELVFSETQQSALNDDLGRISVLS